MLASSWKAKGLVERAWKRLDPPTRQELSRLTGIAEPNLSGMNTGRLPTTLESARRICSVVPGLTPADLGAVEEEGDGHAPTIADRLEALATKLADSLDRQTKMDKEIRSLRTRVRKLEARSEAAPASPKRPRKAAQ